MSELDRIPHSRPSRAAGDLEAIERVLESGHLADGPEARALEAESARAAGRRWAVAVSSGQAALHIGLRVLDAVGDRVALPSYVCASVLLAARHAGARVALGDCAADSVNLDPESPAIDGARAVVVPHMFGDPAPMPRFVERARSAGAAVIEDCAMAAGATVAGRPAGAAGDLSVFSFYATKMATCGQGGLLLGDDPALEARARDLLAYDNRDDFQLRFNFQLTDLQAALARRQWAELPRFVARRRELAERYDWGIDADALKRIGGRLPKPGPGACRYRYLVDLAVADRRDKVRKFLGERGIEAKSPVFRPLHRYLGQSDLLFEHATRLQEGLLSIPLYPALSDAGAARVVEGVNAALHASARVRRP